jgi:hypothetical protein
MTEKYYILTFLVGFTISLTINIVDKVYNYFSLTRQELY